MAGHNVLYVVIWGFPENRLSSLILQWVQEIKKKSNYFLIWKWALKYWLKMLHAMGLSIFGYFFGCEFRILLIEVNRG